MVRIKEVDGGRIKMDVDTAEKHEQIKERKVKTEQIQEIKTLKKALRVANTAILEVKEELKNLQKEV